MSCYYKASQLSALQWPQLREARSTFLVFFYKNAHFHASRTVCVCHMPAYKYQRPQRYFKKGIYLWISCDVPGVQSSTMRWRGCDLSAVIYAVLRIKVRGSNYLISELSVHILGLKP